MNHTLKDDPGSELSQLVPKVNLEDYYIDPKIKGIVDLLVMEKDSNFPINTGMLYGPAKAANAGGVATSGREMSQNSQRLSWTREEVDHKLKTIMANIHATAVAHAREYSSDKSFTNYVTGANIAGFVKVADSMIDQGVV